MIRCKFTQPSEDSHSYLNFFFFRSCCTCW